MRARAMTWVRAPILRFLAGGAVLFLVVHRPMSGATTPAAPRVAPIVLTADDVARLRADYAREAGREPTAADEAALVERALEEELLFREAVARGIDRRDRSVRNWLVQQMSVLAPDQGADEDALYARARTLGLDQTDLVVRRIVVQQMRLLAGRAGERAPGEDELRAFYERHRDDYRAPDRMSFRHVFVSSEAHGPAAGSVATAVLDALRREGVAPDAVGQRGDAFPLAPRVVDQSSAQIAKVFGARFAEQLAAAESGRWIGPVSSPYGAHLVWIESRHAGAPPPLAALRGRVTERWQQEQREARVEALLEDLKTRYPARVASNAWNDRSQS